MSPVHWVAERIAVRVLAHRWLAWRFGREGADPTVWADRGNVAVVDVVPDVAHDPSLAVVDRSWLNGAGHRSAAQAKAGTARTELWDHPRVTDDPELPERNFGWWDMFVAEGEDARADGGWDNDERSVLLGFLSDRRLTLQMKCEGLDAEQMARRSVPPSDMSLLGLVRHLTGVEQHWSRRVIAGLDVPELYTGPDGSDTAFDVEPDPHLVDTAWKRWRTEIGHTNAVIDGVVDLGQLGLGEPVPVREVLVHLIREYAQHLGHADLLRERIDGRVGQ